MKLSAEIPIKLKLVSVSKGLHRTHYVTLQLSVPGRKPQTFSLATGQEVDGSVSANYEGF